MHIVHIASEIAPIAKVGGLADVLFGLSREVSSRNDDVDIILPKYDCIDLSLVHDLGIDTPSYQSFFRGALYENTLWRGWVENLKVYFVQPHHPQMFFERGCFYGCHDDVDRYLYFARSALEALAAKNITPDILHIHDWQAAAVAPLAKKIFSEKNLGKTKIVLTLHNLEYQGVCSPSNLSDIGLDPAELMRFDKALDPYRHDHANLLKAGIVYADAVTTVSPTYAKDILTPLGGKGLESTLEYHKKKLHGIINGLDYTYWNPELDKHLPAHYSHREIPKDAKDIKTFEQKGYNKFFLRQRLSMEESYKPIVAAICRLVPQKGIDLLKKALFHTLERGGQFILMGTAPIPEIAESFQHLIQQLSDNLNVKIVLHHQEDLAHQVYAASDIILAPSIFEPCGLTQLIAMKYGSIPLVRKTGGLKDTVFDFDDPTTPLEKRNGYLFEEPSEAAIAATLDRALDVWYNNHEIWHERARKVMSLDFSWRTSAEKYIAIYKDLLNAAPLG